MGYEKFTEKDPLTDLHYIRSFMLAAGEFLRDAQPGAYGMVAVDMEHFRIINKLYGRESGDKLLVYIAGCLRQCQRANGGVAGYFGGDNFCIVMPLRMELIYALWAQIAAGAAQWNKLAKFLPAFGVYQIDGLDVPLETMYDRATMALSHAIGNLANRICVYEPSMEDALAEEWQLLSEIRMGLDNDEFTFYAQPQCNITTGKIVGAESLVRWIHEGQVIPPGRFIPVLEKNGTVTALDEVVWMKVVQWLRSWMDRGYRPVPISINISRIDILSIDVPTYLAELAAAYDIPVKYIKCEITESAYAEEGIQVDNTVRRLREAGFTVMMDDFGSGYSSLNTLKSLAVDVLKVDMCFLEMSAENEQKGISILESVVNMARLMGAPIIVEGVENHYHEKLLRNMGCQYAQGYYYYRPMPVEQLEHLLADERRLDSGGLQCKQVESLHMREFLDGNLFSDAMVNNILGPSAFYDVYENQVRITRVNEQYFQLIGAGAQKGGRYGGKLHNHVRDDDRPVLFDLFERAYENRPGSAEGYLHFLRMDGEVLWVYMRMFFMHEKEGHKLYYGSLVDVTAFQERAARKRRLASREIAEITGRERDELEEYYGGIPCGYGLAKILLDEGGKPCDYEVIYTNREMEKTCGGDSRRLRQLILKAFGDDQAELLSKAYQAAFRGETLNHYAYSSVTGRYLQLMLYQHKYGYVACLLRDVTHMHIHEGALNSMVLAYREVYFLHLKDNYVRMIYPDANGIMERGNYGALVNRHFGTGRILPHGEERVREFLSLENLRTALLEKDSVECQYRRNSPDNTEEWCMTSITVSEREDGVPKTAVITIRSIDNIIKKDEKKRQQQMAKTLASMTDGFFIYRAVDGERLLYASPAVMEIFGYSTADEFMEAVGGSFRGIVHPEDLDRVEWEINHQIKRSDENMDYVQYRIIRKDGQIRWIDDCGHLESTEWGEKYRLFYVFIHDITDSITQIQKDKLLNANQFYQGGE